MKMENEKKYRIVVIITFVVLLALGLYIGSQISVNSNNTEIGKDVIEKKDEENEVKVYSENTSPVSTKTYDIEVIYEDYFSECGHKETKKDIVYGTTIEKLKEEEKQKQKNKEAEYTVSTEGNEKLIFKRTLNQFCPNHFNIKLEDGNVNIYNIVNEGVETLEKTLEIPQELIKPELLEELILGIRVDSKADLNLLIEDLES